MKRKIPRRKVPTPNGIRQAELDLINKLSIMKDLTINQKIALKELQIKHQEVKSID